jgi:hypothetical protein
MIRGASKSRPPSCLVSGPNPRFGEVAPFDRPLAPNLRPPVGRPPAPAPAVGPSDYHKLPQIRHSKRGRLSTTQVIAHSMEIRQMPEFGEHDRLTQTLAKRCPQCECTKPLTDFAPDHSKSNGLKSHCRKCDARVHRERYTSRVTPYD